MRFLRDRRPSALEYYTGGASLLVKSAALGGTVLGPVQAYLGNAMKPVVDEGLSDRLIAAAKKRGIQVDINPDVPDHFVPRTKIVSVRGKMPSMIAHEVGHIHLDQSRLGRALQNNLTLAAGTVSPMAGLVSGAIRGKRAAERGDERDGALATTGKSLVVPGLLAAPMLAAEGLATVKGMRMLRGAGASKRILDNARKTLGQGWGTYAMLPAMGAVNDAAAYHGAYTLAKRRSSPSQAEGKEGD